METLKTYITGKLSFFYCSLDDPANFIPSKYNLIVTLLKVLGKTDTKNVPHGV